MAMRLTAARSGALVVAVGFVALLAYALIQQQGTAAAGSRINWQPVPGTLTRRQAAPIALRTFDGVTLEVGAPKEGLTLVNFWASWCPPCRAETPALEEFQQRHGGPRFTVLGIDTQDLSDDAKDFVEKFGVSYPQLRDGNGDTADEYGTTGVPETFLVDPAGKVRLAVPGTVDEEYLREEVEPLVTGGRS